METGDGGTTLLHPTTDFVVVVVVAVRLVTPWVDVDSRKSVDCGDGGHCYYCCHGHSTGTVTVTVTVTLYDNG